VLKKETDVAKAEKTAERRQPHTLQLFFRETMGELRKVNWPTWTEAKNLTIVVLCVMVVMGIFLGLLDFAFSRLFALILG
jgi:preprotein translocase subunit SecE